LPAPPVHFGPRGKVVFHNHSETDMKTGIKSAAFAAVALVGTFGMAEAGQDREHVAQLQGSWIGQVTIRDCASGNVIAGPIATLSTTHQGGTMSETGAGSPVAKRGPGHGAWYRTGRHTFATTFIFQRLDVASGLMIGTQQVWSTNDVSEGSKHYTAKATFVLKDNAGATVGTGCATGEFNRLAW
jgi:hypothetical protein